MNKEIAKISKQWKIFELDVHFYIYIIVYRFHVVLLHHLLCLFFHLFFRVKCGHHWYWKQWIIVRVKRFGIDPIGHCGLVVFCAFAFANILEICAGWISAEWNFDIFWSELVFHRLFLVLLWKLYWLNRSSATKLEYAWISKC